MLTHNEAVRLIKAGEVWIGVDAAWARRFFQESNPAAVRELLGDSVRGQRLIVWSWWGCNLLFLPASLVCALLGFGVWALLASPVVFMVWWLNGAGAGVGAQTFRRSFWPVALATVVASVFQRSATGILSNVLGTDSLRALSVLTLGMSLASARFMYFSASHFVRVLVVRNSHFYEAFQGQAFILTEPQDVH